jgi:hypothetical protein
MVVMEWLVTLFSSPSHGLAQTRFSSLADDVNISLLMFLLLLLLLLLVAAVVVVEW